ncbi:MAG: signal peptide peptidase SppA [Pseudomonadota bacterium]
MSLTAEAIADRRRLKRRVTKWRVIAILALVIAFAGVGFMALSSDGVSGFSDHIARMRVDGMITGERKKLDLLKRLAKTDRVKAVLIIIDSPGGTTSGSEALYEEIRKLAAKKPVVSVLESTATSGGYITAIAGDYIVARGNTVTGSIGVIFQWPQFKELLEKVGVKMRELKSDPLKASPSPFEEPSPEALAVMESLIKDSHDWFLKLVAERRKLGDSETRILGDGRVYTGRQALTAKLIDEVGGEDAALAWLKTNKKIASDLKVVDWSPSVAENLSLPGVLARKIGRILGISFVEGVFEATEKTLTPERLKLDGLISVWQPRN